MTKNFPNYLKNPIAIKLFSCSLLFMIIKSFWRIDLVTND